MKRSPFALIAALGIAGCSKPPPKPPVKPVEVLPPIGPHELRAPSAFAVLPAEQRSQAMFVEASRVLLHPRCANCHPPDDTPRQGNAQVIHDPPVVRGPKDRGVTAMRCETCHQDANVQLARVPGAPDWHLAPLAMAWLTKTPAEICAQIKDPKKNGGRSLAQIVEHVRHDQLVAWGWEPGADREPAPGSSKSLGDLLDAWIATGARCP